MFTTCLPSLTAQKSASAKADFPYVVKEGNYHIKPGYAVATTEDGRAVVYNPIMFMVVEMKAEVFVLSREQNAKLWKEIKRLLCGCPPKSTCFNGRCIYDMTVTLSCYPACPPNQGCINGKCVGKEPPSKTPTLPVWINGQLLTGKWNPVRCSRDQLFLAGLCVPGMDARTGRNQITVDGKARSFGPELAVFELPRKR